MDITTSWMNLPQPETNRSKGQGEPSPPLFPIVEENQHGDMNNLHLSDNGAAPTNGGNASKDTDLNDILRQTPALSTLSHNPLFAPLGSVAPPPGLSGVGVLGGHRRVATSIATPRQHQRKLTTPGQYPEEELREMLGGLHLPSAPPPPPDMNSPGTKRHQELMLPSFLTEGALSPLVGTPLPEQKKELLQPVNVGGSLLNAGFLTSGTTTTSNTASVLNTSVPGAASIAAGGNPYTAILASQANKPQSFQQHRASVGSSVSQQQPPQPSLTEQQNIQQQQLIQAQQDQINQLKAQLQQQAQNAQQAQIVHQQPPQAIHQPPAQSVPPPPQIVHQITEHRNSTTGSPLSTLTMENTGGNALAPSPAKGANIAAPASRMPMGGQMQMVQAEAGMGQMQMTHGHIPPPPPRPDHIVGRIPANKHDNRKLFVGGLPNEG